MFENYPAIRDRAERLLPKAMKYMGALALIGGVACEQPGTAPSARDIGSPVNTVTATSTQLIVDTGPGGTDPGFVVAGGTPEFPTWQYLAGQFAVSGSTDLESIAIWGKIFVGGDVTVHIRTDDSGEPGTDVFTKTYTVGTTADFGWYTFTDYNTTIPAGTYWVTLETPINGGLIISMPQGAASPLSKYAFKGTNFANWSQSFGTTPTMGFQIAANVAETPSDMIGDLGSFVGGAGLPSGSQSSINSKLTTALNAIGAGDKATACGALTAAANYARAQSGKSIPAGTAASIISQANDIRSALGC
jgi:hypothetical protein